MRAREADLMDPSPSVSADGFEDDGLRIEATPLQVKMGYWAACVAEFCFKHSWIPLSKRFGHWCMRRAFWFSGGDVPFRSTSRQRDAKYLESRAYRGP